MQVKVNTLPLLPKAKNVSPMTVDAFLTKLFDKFDGNADGRLTRFEFSEALKYLTRIAGATFPNRHDIFDLFAHFDNDGDETISKEEYRLLTRNLINLIESTGVSLLTRVKV